MRRLMRLIVCAGIAAVGATEAFAQGKGETFRIQDYPGVGNMLIRVAIAKGFCDKRGIKCQLQMIPSGPLGGQALLAKSIDVGFFPPETQIAAMVKGANLKAIASGAVLNVFIVVARNDIDMPNATKGFPAFMADLKGKKIGVTARGATSEIMFSFMAKKAGLQPEDFTFVAVGAPNTAFGALSSKQVDANMTFEPSGALCDVLKSCRVLFRAAQSEQPPELFAINGAASNFVVTQDTIDKMPGGVEGLIKATQDAEAFIQDAKNYPEVFKIATDVFKFDMPKGDEVMDVALKLAIPAYKASISRPALKAITDYLLTTKQIEAPFDPARLVWDKTP